MSDPGDDELDAAGVEAAAEGIWRSLGGQPWMPLSPPYKTRETYRANASAAITAYLNETGLATALATAKGEVEREKAGNEVLARQVVELVQRAALAEDALSTAKGERDAAREALRKIGAHCPGAQTEAEVYEIVRATLEVPHAL